MPLNRRCSRLSPGTQTHRLFGAAEEVYWSDDRGTTWQKSATGPRFVSNVVVAGGFVFAASLRGLYRAAIGAPSSWTIIPVGGTVSLPVTVDSFANDPRDATTLFAFGAENVGIYTVVRLDWHPPLDGRRRYVEQRR